MVLIEAEEKKKKKKGEEREKEVWREIERKRARRAEGDKFVCLAYPIIILP